MANKNQTIKYGVELDEAAMARMEARIQRFMRMFTGATAKADAETQRRTAEFMASGQGAAYMRNAPPGYRYDPLGANASQIYSSKQSQQRFRAQQQYLRTGKEPGVSFTDRAFGKLHEISERLDPQRRAIGTATGGLADMVSGGLGSSPSQTIAGAGSAAKGLLGLLGPIGRFAGGVIGGAAAGTAAGVALGIPGYREYMARLPSQETLANRSSLPQSFEGLGTVLTKLGHDLQMVGSEAGRLALSFAKVSGATDAGLYDRVRNAGLFARGFGMDPQSAAAGFGRAEYMGFGGSEAKQKQFANLLGRTIAEGGMMGNSEQVMEDMLKHIQGVEQNTGEMPSMSALGEYASLRASLYQNPALKGPGGDSAIGGITSILRGRDNGPKDAFLIGAFGKEIGGSLTNLQWLRDANPFESVRSVTGQGGEGETILDRAMAFSKTMAGQFNDPAELRKKQAALLSTLGNFNSHQAYAFIDAYGKMGNGSVGDVQKWLQGMGHSGEMSEGSIANQIRLYNTRNDRGGLTTMADEYIKASNTSDADKKALEAAKGQSNEKLAAELARVIEATGQQSNSLRDHNQKLADAMNHMADEFGPSIMRQINAMTDLGDLFIDPLSWSLDTLAGYIEDLVPHVRTIANWLSEKLSDPKPGDMGYGVTGSNRPQGDGAAVEAAGNFLRNLWDSVKDAVFGPDGLVKVSHKDVPVYPSHWYNNPGNRSGSPTPGAPSATGPWNVIRDLLPDVPSLPSAWDVLGMGKANATMDIGQYDPSEGMQMPQILDAPPIDSGELAGSVVTSSKSTNANRAKLFGDKKFMSALVKFSNDRGIDPNNVLAMMKFESGGYKTNVTNSYGYKGLFQAGRQLWKGDLGNKLRSAGFSHSTFQNEPAARQLQAYQIYYDHWQAQTPNNKIDSLGDLAALQLAPGTLRNQSGAMYRRGTKAYQANAPLDINGDGIINREEYGYLMRKRYGDDANAANAAIAKVGRTDYADISGMRFNRPQSPVSAAFPYTGESESVPGMARIPELAQSERSAMTQPGMARLPDTAPIAANFPLTSGATSPGASHSIEVFVKDERGQVIGSAHKPLQPRAKNVREPGYGQQVAQFDLNHGLR